ncbi:MAG: hypothetical protein QOJ12_5, partial [Thermoleophilales bacterium]|nr:hypothetical protein [Thermoleophilales bacterium]
MPAVKVSPVARRVAADLGVELAALAGSGPAGRIVKRDVEAASRKRASGNGAAPAPPGPPAATAPELALTTDVDMDEAVRLRAQLEELDPERVPSFDDLVVKACARALRRHPRANGAYRDGSFELFEWVNVGVSVAAGDALVAATIVDADRKSLGAVADESRALASRARDNELTPPELAGGTFTVSNLGMFGVTHFTEVLDPPQAATLAVGALEQRAVARDGRPAVGWRMTITLTCDRRVLNGADGAAFLAD